MNCSTYSRSHLSKLKNNNLIEYNEEKIILINGIQ